MRKKFFYHQFTFNDKIPPHYKKKLPVYKKNVNFTSNQIQKHSFFLLIMRASLLYLKAANEIKRFSKEIQSFYFILSEDKKQCSTRFWIFCNISNLNKRKPSATYSSWPVPTFETEYSTSASAFK